MDITVEDDGRVLRKVIRKRRGLVEEKRKVILDAAGYDTV